MRSLRAHQQRRAVTDGLGCRKRPRLKSTSAREYFAIGAITIWRVWILQISFVSITTSGGLLFWPFDTMMEAADLICLGVSQASRTMAHKGRYLPCARHHSLLGRQGLGPKLKRTPKKMCVSGERGGDWVLCRHGRERTQIGTPKVINEATMPQHQLRLLC